MKKIVIPVIIIILYLLYRVISSDHNWFDIGINDFPHIHTINILNGQLQIVPWDVIIDVGGTVAIILALLYVFIVGGKNYNDGLKGKL